LICGGKKKPLSYGQHQSLQPKTDDTGVARNSTPSSRASSLTNRLETALRGTFLAENAPIGADPLAILAMMRNRLQKRGLSKAAERLSEAVYNIHSDIAQLQDASDRGKNPPEEDPQLTEAKFSFLELYLSMAEIAYNDTVSDDDEAIRRIEIAAAKIKHEASTSP
jgi:hypothetical protein